MKLIFYFDLDDCLFNTTEHEHKYGDNEDFYNNIIPNNNLYNLLNKLPGKKHILTNANRAHASYVLHKLKLNNINNLISTDLFNLSKPNIEYYKTSNKWLNIDNDNSLIFFFEDTVNNLKTAKKMNWKTILINNNNITKNYDFVDHQFNTIEDSLLFFIDLLNQRSS
tara:strand:+ start:302 stop:802 length:501 start_codon:yes stop_codon:yes gene_type:complete